MKIIFKCSKIGVFALLALSIYSCSNDDNAGDVIIPDNSIADFVADNEDYSSLAAALEVAGLTATLDGSTNYTVFAPNNAAFNSFLSENGFESLDEVPEDLLREVLLNHVQEGEIMSGDFSTGYISSMATGMASEDSLSLYINVKDEVMINGVSTVSNGDIEVDNGVIHAVDAVIGLPDVTTFVTADPNFTILVEALTREEDYTFVETLQLTDDPAPFTVFAPTNEAFQNVLDELELAGLGNIPSDLLASILSYHVVAQANVRSGDLSDDMSVETLESGSFTVHLGDNVTITDENGRTSTIVAADVQANNGVIHVLDTVILPENDGIEIESNTIADFFAGNEDYSSLLAALEATGLTGVFTGTEGYTFFAPNNDAFAAFLNENGFSSLDEVPEDLLTEVLMNHLQAGVITSGDLSTGYIESMATGMASEENLSMYINTEDGVIINGMVSVTTADIEADNGIIHAVDAVIGLPDIVDFATADPTFDILVQALTLEDDFTFVKTLQMIEDPAPFTVFAPTNKAFADLLEELEIDSLDDIATETLSEVLSYHVITGANARSADLRDAMEVETLQGEEITINVSDTVSLTDANGRTSRLVVADVQANNGVIHAVDTVILPAM